MDQSSTLIQQHRHHLLSASTVYDVVLHGHEIYVKSCTETAAGYTIHATTPLLSDSGGWYP